MQSTWQRGTFTCTHKITTIMKKDISFFDPTYEPVVGQLIGRLVGWLVYHDFLSECEITFRGTFFILIICTYYGIITYGQKVTNILWFWLTEWFYVKVPKDQISKNVSFFCKSLYSLENIPDQTQITGLSVILLVRPDWGRWRRR